MLRHTKGFLALLVAALCVSHGYADNCYTISLSVQLDADDSDTWKAQEDAIRQIVADTSGVSIEDVRLAADLSQIVIGYEDEDAANEYYSFGENSPAHDRIDNMLSSIDTATDITLVYWGMSGALDLDNPACSPFGGDGEDSCVGAFLTCGVAHSVEDLSEADCDAANAWVKCIEEADCCSSDIMQDVLKTPEAKACNAKCGTATADDSNGSAMRQPLQAWTWLCAFFASTLALSMIGL